MESTVSVSKGVFLFRNGFKKTKKQKRKSEHPLFNKLYEKDWYSAYKKNWNCIENNLKTHHSDTYSLLLNNIVNYIKDIHVNDEFQMKSTIPSVTLLTGVNQPDHASQFTALIELLRNEVTPHVAIVSSQDGNTIKHLIENAVWQLINGEELDISDNDCDGISKKKYKFKRNQCTMRTLKTWYHSQYSNKSTMEDLEFNIPLVIILPDFESFNINVLQDFVMIISSYISSLPIVFVFGVATSVSALHKSFPIQVSSKLLIKVFQTHSALDYVNQVVEEIFLRYTIPFQLSGKTLELLTDVFLFYDLSVTELIQNIKYCMLDHYYGDNVKSLCCDPQSLKEAILNLTSQDLVNIRRLISFRPYVLKQDNQTIIDLFKNDEFFKEAVYKEMNALHKYLYSFHACVRLLFALVKDLPKNSIGKTIRETYIKCTTEFITKTEDFKECMQLINFQSQLNLVETINNAMNIVNSYLKDFSPGKPLTSTPKKNKFDNISIDEELGFIFVKNIKIHLLTFLRQLKKANTENISFHNMDMDVDFVENVPANRYKLKEKLLKATKSQKIQSEFEMIRSRFVSYLEEMFTIGLQPPHTRTFYEILFFTDVSRVKKQIVGSPRGALHTALTNPVHYLQCLCCHLPTVDSLVNTLPDLCIGYKLFLECGKHINLYDWLQAFAAVILPDEDDENRHQDGSIRVRFTKAVAVLQFLGFIKLSKRKTDHVMRLTW